MAPGGDLVACFPFAEGAGRGRRLRRGRPSAPWAGAFCAALTCHSAKFLLSGTTLSDYCDLDYIDAPHRCSPADDEKQDPLITQVFEGPYHEWFNANRRWAREGGGVEYNYLEESLGAVADAVKRRGPYDGFIGFSQGGPASLARAAAPEPRALSPQP